MNDFPLALAFVLAAIEEEEAKQIKRPAPKVVPIRRQLSTMPPPPWRKAA